VARIPARNPVQSLPIFELDTVLRKNGQEDLDLDAEQMSTEPLVAGDDKEGGKHTFKIDIMTSNPAIANVSFGAADAL